MTITKEILFKIVAKKQQPQKNPYFIIFFIIFIQLVNELKTTINFRY